MAQAKSELRTWRRVYWRLWGAAHWLRCARCGAAFAVGRVGWCRSHPQPPHFAGGQRPDGLHPCCGQRVLRFAPLRAPTVRNLQYFRGGYFYCEISGVSVRGARAGGAGRGGARRVDAVRARANTRRTAAAPDAASGRPPTRAAPDAAPGLFPSRSCMGTWQVA